MHFSLCLLTSAASIEWTPLTYKLNMARKLFLLDLLNET